VVGAALKYDQGKDDKGDLKLDAYDTKLDGMNCYDPNPEVGDDKPKIECGLQTDLNTDLIAAQGACP